MIVPPSSLLISNLSIYFDWMESDICRLHKFNAINILVINFFFPMLNERKNFSISLADIASNTKYFSTFWSITNRIDYVNDYYQSHQDEIQPTRTRKFYLHKSKSMWWQWNSFFCSSHLFNVTTAPMLMFNIYAYLQNKQNNGRKC